MKTNSVKAWLLASRPKTLTGAAAPVIVGGTMAFVMFLMPVVRKSIDMYGELRLDDNFMVAKIISYGVPFVLCLLFAFLMQIDANFINDYFDFKKGTDREDRLGPERACAQGWITPCAMKWGIGITTVLSVAVGMLIMMWHMQWELLVVGLFCVVFCFLYTTRLSYLGWGDVLVLVFFGIVPVVFTFYVMTGGLYTIPLVLASIAMGLATDNLLMVNNYRDRNQDVLSGKRTIVVRIISACKDKKGGAQGRIVGERLCLRLYLWIGIVATVLGIIAADFFCGTAAKIPFLLIYLILHVKAYLKMKSLDGKELNKVLGMTARNIFLFGVLLAVSCF